MSVYSFQRLGDLNVSQGRRAARPIHVGKLSGDRRLLLELVGADLERVAVEQPGELVDHRLASVLDV